MSLGAIPAPGFPVPRYAMSGGGSRYGSRNARRLKDFMRFLYVFAGYRPESLKINPNVFFCYK